MKTNSLFFIAALAVSVAFSCAKKPEVKDAASQLVYVSTEPVVETSVSRPVQCSGTLSSKQISKLSFKTGGIIHRIYVGEGAMVTQGQLLATLDMTEISAQVQQARVALEKAERDLKRVQSLYADTVATLEQLQNAKSAYDAAMENRNIAEFNSRYSKIVAPANGKILSKLAEENELTSPGMPVLVFGAQGKDGWVIKTGLSDKDIVAIHKGDKASVSFDAFGGKDFSALVTQMAEVADPASGTFEVELTVEPGKEKLINGMVAAVKIHTSGTQQVTLVPPDAITEANGTKGFVNVLNAKDSTARKVPVTIAYIQDREIAILEPKDKLGTIITQGAAYIEDGTRVGVR